MEVILVFFFFFKFLSSQKSKIRRHVHSLSSNQENFQTNAHKLRQAVIHISIIIVVGLYSQGMMN